jgi:EAL domain-containing protein (putative c-di-GMP-specific phosphodiesterase class I)
MNSGLEVVPISINMSSIQLRQNDLATRCLNHLKEFDIDPNLVEIELTESELVNNYDNSMTRLKQLKEAGFRLIMDDFGTGYSSLSYLRKIPLSGIKIDKSFIDDIDEKNEDSINLIASIISISHSLGLQVVAEGVESKHQAEHLASLGCELLQGYYFSRPVSSVKAADIIKEKVMVPSA